jgi:hypothetical protein
MDVGVLVQVFGPSWRAALHSAEHENSRTGHPRPDQFRDLLVKREEPAEFSQPEI